MTSRTPAMMADPGHSVTTTFVRGCVIVTFPSEIAGGLERVQRQALDGVQRVSARAAVLELSAVQFMDCTEYEGIRTLVGMLRLLGARCLVVGLRPGVVAWLIRNELDLRGMEFEYDLEGALEKLGIMERESESGE